PKSSPSAKSSPPMPPPPPPPASPPPPSPAPSASSLLALARGGVPSSPQPARLRANRRLRARLCVAGVTTIVSSKEPSGDEIAAGVLGTGDGNIELSGEKRHLTLPN